MGLDMYLMRKKYIGANYEHRKVSGEIRILQDGKEIPIKFNKVVYIEEQVAYWRKANAIHKWFVDSVQNSVDNCGDYYVSIDEIEDLLETCKKVKADKSLATLLLPTQEGFFFGGTDYDEYYFDEIDYTIKTFEEILEEEKKLNEKGIYSDFQYSSSW